MPDYDADLYGWANEQAALLRAGRLSDADIGNIAEEIESMGRSEKRELTNRLAVPLQHLLKRQLQPNLRSTCRRLTVQEQRRRLISLLKDNPSPRAKFAEAVGEAYDFALISAQRETELPRPAFPDASPYTIGEIMDESSLPA